MVVPPTDTINKEDFERHTPCRYSCRDRFSSRSSPSNRRFHGLDDRDRFGPSSPTDLMADFDSLSAEWTVWNRSEARCVLVYRPDVFDADAFPAPCLPTIYLTHGRRSRRPGPRRAPGTEGAWYVSLFFEPE